ncbi:MAG TPA: hypothetical protein VLM38_15045 [Blastocatellia bacterium]|nr:hypothetical protein [Blastocatellia bacterium]
MVSKRGSLAGDRRVLTTLILILVSSGLACNGAPKTGNANSPTSVPRANNTPSPNPESHESSSPGVAIDIKDPDRFSIAVTISAQEINADPSKMPTLQFTLSEFDADRRWAFSLPALGQVVYLEKSGLKYLVLSDRKQYVEVAPGDLGFQSGRELTPSSLANQLKSRARLEMLGVEPVNGRTARKYRFKDAGDGSQANGMIYVDIETGLAVRIEVVTHPTSGNGLRVIVEGRDIQLNPDRSLFDVPAEMRKVSQQDAKQAIETVAGVLRSFAGLPSGSPAPSPTVAGPAANRNAPSRR